MKGKVLRRGDTQFPWLNFVQYPYRTREFDTGDGWMSYLDEGQGRPVVFVHGSPTWSYLWRHMIRVLAPYHRCIAPDLLGFGMSEKPQNIDYRPEKQAERFADLMSYLDLRDVTLVVHDHGGPIGLNWAVDYPGRVREIVLFNTWCWSLKNNRSAMRLARLVGNPLNRFYYRALNASPSFIMPALFADRHRISRATQRQYLEPFRSYRERQALYSMIEGLRQGGAWFDSILRRMDALEAKRFLLLWGTKDPIFGPDALARWKSELPNHETVEFPWVGRFVPEEAAKQAAEEIRWFMMRSPAFTA
ncbi:alpha/beta fold hydrolase [soil metagenome]